MHATICDYLADLVQNAIEAGGTRIGVELAENEEQLMIDVTDNGKGMDAAAQARIWDPFYSEPGKHDRRRVGLGLPLLRQAVEATGGTITLDSAPGRGTAIQFSFPVRHVDCPPLGDLPGTLLGLMAHDGDYELTLARSRMDRAYVIRRSELADALGDLREAGNLVLAREFLRGQEADLMNTSSDGLPEAASGARQEERQ